MAVVDTISDSDMKDLYRKSAQRACVEHDKLMESRRTGDWSIFYGKRSASVTTSTLPTTSTQVARPDVDAYRKFFLGQRGWETPVKLPSNVEKTLYEEACQAFTSILPLYIAGDEAFIATHTTRIVRPYVLPGEQETIQGGGSARKGLRARALLVYKEFQTIAGTPTLYSVHLFNISTDAITTCSVRETSESPKTYATMIMVRLRYDNLRDWVGKNSEIMGASKSDMEKETDLKRKSTMHFLASRFPQITDDGDPLVTMVWQAGQWYWNPFGHV